MKKVLVIASLCLASSAFGQGVPIKSGANSNLADVFSNGTDKGVAMTLISATNNCYEVSAQTGTMAAALGANSTIFAMRLNPGASVKAYVRHVKVTYTTIVAYTTPVTASRVLSLWRGSTATPSGGTAIAAVEAIDPGAATSQFNSANSGDARVSTTGALTVTSVVYEAQPLYQWTLTHVGAAGGFYEFEEDWNLTTGRPMMLTAGQLLAVRNIAAMDAAGTWQATVHVDWCER